MACLFAWKPVSTEVERVADEDARSGDCSFTSYCASGGVVLVPSCTHYTLRARKRSARMISFGCARYKYSGCAHLYGSQHPR